MSVWSLLDCALAMMEVSKRVVRKEDPTARDRVLGAIAFDVFESGSPSGASARERMERVSRRVQRVLDKGVDVLDEGIDGIQPYLVMRSDLEGSSTPELWRGVGRLVLRVGVRGGWSDEASLRVHTEAFRQAYYASRRKEEAQLPGSPEGDVREWVRSVRNVILRSWSQVSPSRYWREKLVIYLLRQLEKGGERELGEVYRELAEFAKSSVTGPEVGPVPLADILTLLKLARGGAW